MFQGMRYVYEVYKEMSFSRAAKNLYISQPSLSTAVKKAEDRIGFPIFDRSTSPIQLTELGREYIRAAETMLDVENGFRSYVDDLSGMRNGSLTIGATNLFASFVLPPLLARFIQKYPMIHIELAENGTVTLAEGLAAGKLDLVVDYALPDEAGFGRKFLFQEHLLLAVPAAFPCNDQARNYAFTPAAVKEDVHLTSRVPPVPLELFQEEPFLLLRQGNDTRERAEALCQTSRFFPKIRLELEQQITTYHLTSSGMGISFVSDMLIKQIPDDPGVVFYKLDPRIATREAGFYYRRNRYMSRSVQEFLKLLNGAA